MLHLRIRWLSRLVPGLLADPITSLLLTVNHALLQELANGWQRMKSGICMIMARCMAALVLGWASPTGAQPRPLVLSPTPETEEAGGPFCYYAGLSYSAGAVVTVKVPVRREVVTDRPWQELRCEIIPTSPGSVAWVEVDPDEGDPFRD
jgi:hypothetical protein